jgi:pSer/pThr/pTyr-binding forkhead associated (FHA) protein
MNRTHPEHPGGVQSPHRITADVPFETAIAPLRLLVLPEGRAVELLKPAVVVGRHSDVEVRLAYPDVSRRHCRLVFANGLWCVQDLDSLNGVFVNDERMHEATLYEGDRVRVGAATLVVLHAPTPCGVLRSISDALAATEYAI